MRKLKLEIDDLEVTSFAATPETISGERGTVEAHKTAEPITNNGALTCNGEVTCDATCANTCGATCGGVCGSWPLTYCAQCYYEA